MRSMLISYFGAVNAAFCSNLLFLHYGIVQFLIEGGFEVVVVETETEDDDVIAAVDEGTESHPKLEAVLVLKHENGTLEWFC
ncbi:hypothetical protein PIB30_094521 [Stylosanthes scabra]|uniref:Uncharacterized protein n=1 Tax=Stylosanthes scabra TaxID=79078 RepID=A0ABU6ZU97_9FABA|nr:hypothetical protein [Stylosanthes scabra]